MTYPEFKKQFHIRLNSQQEAAVQQTTGPVLLLAVPGSGKTTVLVARLGCLIFCRGIAPESILTVTYTVAAAGDMRRRFARQFGEELAGQLEFRTINSLCVQVIRHYAWRRGTKAFELADDTQLNGVLRSLLVRQGVSFPSDQQVKDLRTHITFCKNMMFTEAEIQQQKEDGMDFPALYRGYQEFLRKNRLMDFDDQMVFTYSIFRQYPDILAHFQRRWNFLCVDEAQDTSKIQHVILRLLASKSRNIFMVGDEDQSIYGFRAAWPQALLEFEQVWPGAKVLQMETNYRSTKAIVDRADAFIQRNQSRHPKHMRTDNPQGEDIRKITLGDYNRQYNYLLKVAQDCTVPTAVLYRNNDSALPLINLLEQNHIPYSCRQRESFFFSSPVVRDLTDMLVFAFNDCDKDLFLHFYYKLDLKIKKSFLSELLLGKPEDEPVLQALIDSEALEPWQLGKARALQTHFSKIPQLTSFAALQRLVKYMGYGEYMEDQHMDTSRLDILLALANQTPETNSFLLRLDELREVIEGQEPDPDCPFILSTIHASKGLEYDRVFLMDVVDGLFPSVSEPEPGRILNEEDQAALEEERRLFYVGVTRARHQLNVLCYSGKFGDLSGTESTFISQLLGEGPKAAFYREQPEQKPVMPKKSGPTAAQVAVLEKDYIPGAWVVHKHFGTGHLESRTGSIAVIFFPDAGMKKLDLPTCLRQGLIALKID